ncbi:MAG: hypothetical protein ACE5I7_11600 [Candidatus Binatia bacterium]
MDMPRGTISIMHVALGVPLSVRRNASRSTSKWGTLLVAGALCVGFLVAPAAAVDLASVSAGGGSGSGGSNGVAVNDDGNFVVFYSDAGNLVPGDTNGKRDVFVRDRSGAMTERVSVSSSGEQANGASHATGVAPGISADGQVVAFYSAATNLVADDTNGQTDVFVRFRDTGVTELVSKRVDGTLGDGASVNPSISADGRFVAFQSQASNLVPNDTNNTTDIFVVDLETGDVERACDSVEPDRFSFSPSINADGNFVAFASAATNLVPDDTNGKLDIFVCDRSTGQIERVSVGTGGQGNGDSILPAISGDGRVVGFKSLADDLVPSDANGVVDVFVHDRVAGLTERISVNMHGGDANDFSFPPSLSNDGRFVAFGSFGTNLVPNDTNITSNVFVRDRQIGATVLVDVNGQGQQANNGTSDVPPAMSGDGLQIGFVSFATNLVTNDGNHATDVFVSQNPFFGPGSCPDGVCPAGEVCVKGFCANPTPTAAATKTPTAPPTGTPTLTPTRTPTFKPCTDDSMCPPDKHCRAGFCKIKRPCDDEDPAVDRHECRSREACIDNLCECGGDCNLDGIVFGNEITQGILILGGVAPLDQCTAADINGDGQVLGNEITLAVLNLGEGCVQEGQPLIFARDRGGMVTLTVGSASIPDGSGAAAISVDLSGGEGEVATAQLDVLFDPTMIEIGDPGVACKLDDRLADQVFLATLPDAPPAPPGLKRLRLFVGDVTAPIATFDDGTIVTCRFQVQGGAGAATVLAVDNLNVGDARGNIFGSQAVSGGVSILVPTATAVPAPTPAPPCPGDCNADGEVLGNEITVAVRILAGQESLQECAAADADGDGQVMVTDVTRAVISLGRGCPR